MLVLFTLYPLGVLIPMFVAFLTSRRRDSRWLKGHVVLVNVLIMGKTIIHIIQGFDALNQLPPRPFVSLRLSIVEAPVLKIL